MGEHRRTVPEPCLYVGEVRHHRLRPFSHYFEYRVFSVLIDLDRLSDLDRRLALFSVNRPNLVSFQERDHGRRDGSPLRPWVESQLARAGLDPDGGPIRLLCLPRVLGYVFNPLSIYYCYSHGGQLRAVLHEVHNTFGEQHAYALPVRTAAAPDETVLQECGKAFYVSPFIEMAGHYRFRLVPPGNDVRVAIRAKVREGPQLVATFTGTRRALTDRRLALALLRCPFMTHKVIAAIHWQALRLWAKGAPRFARPQPPPRPHEIHREDTEPS